MASNSSSENIAENGSVTASAEDSLLGMNKKKVTIKEDDIKGGGDANLNLPGKRIGTVAEFLLNESSSVPAAIPDSNHTVKGKEDEIPESCTVNVEEDEESGAELDFDDKTSEEKAAPVPEKVTPVPEPPQASTVLQYDPTIDTRLPETVSLLKTSDGAKVYLVGTAHFSMESQEDVSTIIRAVQPHTVLVELCKSRVDILQLDEKTILEEAKNINFGKIQSTIKVNGLFHGLMYILLLNMTAHLTEQLGMAPGGEFRRAFAEARQIPNCLIHLGDRPIHITLQRALALLSWWQSIRLMWHLLTAKEPISKEEMERCKRKDLLDEMLAEIAGEFPAVGTVFVNERDVFLTHSLQLAAMQQPSSGTGPTRVVGVVGIGHVPGIVQNWGKVTPGDIPPIMRVPPPSLTSRVLKLTFKASMFGLVVWGVSKIIPFPRSLPSSIVAIRTSVHDFFHIGGAGQGRF